MSEEEWRPIPGWEGAYEASNLGRVRSLRGGHRWGRVLKPHIRTTSGGYPQVSLGLNGTTCVHVCVAGAFLGPRPPGHQVRHLDGDPLNNRVENLAWGTPSENQHDKIQHGRHQEVNKTHCPQGHPYDEANTHRATDREGRPRWRKCRACNRARCAVRREQRSQRAAGMRDPS
jgi:hypothetical protein